ncbi:dTDP-4-amino-4,6-dideoxygalactose transaminase [Nitriliruptor alkaliphilus]|uniref:dTDP-4-amino-4,6-dideoxygalactose transaminase n=1 Tax=Nitriliruptor alkaliphilus TaxID=427918 RepID=UPI0006989962|nr:dTDP-4-amino-4,6-dideoxygalactose transaminase [Nitriliruptor alkaliphilus]
MSDRSIRFNVPTVEGRELEHVAAAVRGGHTASSGPFTELVSTLLAEHHGAPDALLTTSCTDALEMTALMLDLGPGDAVVVPSFTFVTSALAYTRTGARLLFCDIERDTLALDPVQLERLLATHPNVRCVVHVHYAGIAGRIAEVADLVARYPRVTLVEDNAHGLFGMVGERTLGTYGRFSTLSFHETKNFICGEGGALIVNDEADVGRAHVLLDKGTDRRAFSLGLTDKYTWRDTGSSFGLSDMLAAYLWGQLEQRETILAQRRGVFDRYAASLAPVADEVGIRLPVVPEGRTPAWHMFHLLLPDASSRDHALDALRRAGVHATFHYVPLHRSDGGRRFAAAPSECPVTDDVSARLLRLPFHNRMSASEQERVVGVLLDSLRTYGGASAATG